MRPRPDPALALAQEVARAARRPRSARTLLLDLDGTLAPIAATPGRARVPRRTLEALAALVELGWSVAVISGRPAAEARALVPLRGLRVFGSHGGEPQRLAPELVERLAKLTVAAASLASGSPGALVEIKPAGIVFHDRAVAPKQLARWRRRVRELIAASDLEGLELLAGRRVLEVRPRGHHKGRVLGAVLGNTAPAEHDASIVALGDDRTDEDLFRSLGGRGLTVRVGRPRAGSSAVRRLASPGAVLRFLEELVRVFRQPAQRSHRGGRA
jgi:trehalose-phosphatase